MTKRTGMPALLLALWVQSPTLHGTPKFLEENLCTSLGVAFELLLSVTPKQNT